MANTFITRTPSSAGNKKTFTLSVWVKRTTLGSDYILTARNGTGSLDSFYFGFRADQIQIDSTAGGGDSALTFRSNARYRDTFGWYNIILAVDTTQATESNRAKLYVNGSQITSFEISTYPDQNDDFYGINDTIVHAFGREHYASGTAYHEYILSHIHFIDGTAYDASAFGSTDSTTGEWKINTSPSVTYGTNGFWILKDGNTITDSSPNSNNFTLGGGTLTKTEDNPSNVFCTINPLNSYYAAGTFTYGNNVVLLPNKNGAWNTGTLGMTSGKYYWEIKCTGSSNGEELQLGIADKSPNGNSSGSTAGTSFGYNSNGEYGIYAYNGAFIGNAVANPYTSYGSATTNGIAMIAVDLDNNKFYAGANGTWFASGNPATGANGKTIQAVASTVDGCYYPAISTYQGYDGKVECNFGNGYFADNAVSSAGTNASNNGIFEYDVPSGYTALSTKGLNL